MSTLHAHRQKNRILPNAVFLMLLSCFHLLYHRDDLSDALFAIGHDLPDFLPGNVVQMKAGADRADTVKCRGHFSGQGNGQGVIPVGLPGIDAESAIVTDGRAADVSGAASQKNQHIGSDWRNLVVQRSGSTTYSQFHDSCPQRWYSVWGMRSKSKTFPTLWLMTSSMVSGWW